MCCYSRNPLVARFASAFPFCQFTAACYVVDIAFATLAITTIFFFQGLAGVIFFFTPVIARLLEGSFIILRKTELQNYSVFAFLLRTCLLHVDLQLGVVVVVVVVAVVVGVAACNGVRYSQ